MNLDQFIAKWLGGRTDQDGVFGYQCVDLIKQYAVDVLRVKPGAWGNAIDYWRNTNHPLLSSHSRVASQAPQKGDIVILGTTSTNAYGHIGIAVNANTMLEQNGATGDGDGAGGDEIRYRTIPKSRIAGLLRPKKGADMSKVTTATNRIIHTEMEGWPYHETHAGKFDAQLIAAWNGKDLEEMIWSKWNKNGAFREKRVNAMAAYDSLKASVTQLTSTVKQKDVVIADQAKEIESLRAQVGDNSKWETLKALIRELVGR